MKNKKLLGILCICLLIFLMNGYAEKIKLRVVVEKANVRSKPDLGSPVIRKIPMGAILEAEEQIGEWFKVILSYNENNIPEIGYVHLSVVEIVEEKPPIPPPKPSEPSKPIPQIIEKTERNFSIRFTGGINYSLLTDLNDGIEGLNNFWHDFLTLLGYSIEGKVKPVHLGLNLGSDFIINLNPRIGVGLGIKYIHTSKKGKINFTNGSEGSWTIKPDIKAIPLELSLFLLFPATEKANFTLNIGTGFYTVRLNYNWKFEEKSGEWTEITGEAKGNCFGFHGGAGFEYNILKNLAFIFEIQGRYAKTGTLEGSEEFKENTGWSYKEEGKLYYWKEKSERGKYTFVAIRKNLPSGPAISNGREAKINLSGVNIIAGIKIKF